MKNLKTSALLFKNLFLFFFLLNFFGAALNAADRSSASKSSNNSSSSKPAIPKRQKKLSPFQAQIDQCFKGEIKVADLYDNKKLYEEITKNFTLQASETLFREVLYKQQGENRKLRYEDGLVNLYKVNSDESLSLVETINLNEDTKADGMRYKVLSREARINQHLNQAEIKEDFIKTTEYRSRQLILNLSWSNSKIKSLSVLFQSANQKLECQQKDKADICECRI